MVLCIVCLGTWKVKVLGGFLDHYQWLFTLINLNMKLMKYYTPACNEKKKKRKEKY